MCTRRATADDTLAVHRIADATFGDGYLTGLPDGARTLVAEVGDQVAGFGWWEPQPRAQAEQMATVPFPHRCAAATRFACVKTVAVHPARQRAGVGAALLDALLADARPCADVVWSVAWCRDGTAPIGALLTRVGLTPFAMVPGYWADDSLVRGYVCPACGGPPCRCAAELWAGDALL